MKNEIQQLLNWCEVRQKANSAMHDVMRSQEIKWSTKGRLDELAFFIRELKLLLSDKPTEAITESAHFANTMLDEVPQVGHCEHNESLLADSSETSGVRQNEQTKEVCKHDSTFKYVGKLLKCDKCLAIIKS